MVRIADRLGRPGRCARFAGVGRSAPGGNARGRRRWRSEIGAKAAHPEEKNRRKSDRDRGRCGTRGSVLRDGRSGEKQRERERERKRKRRRKEEG